MDVIRLSVLCLKIDYNKGQVSITTVSEYFAAVSNGPCFGRRTTLSWRR